MCPIARNRSATKASNCGPLIARDISKRAARSPAVGVLGPEKRRASHTTTTTIPSSRSTTSHALPFAAEDDHAHINKRITTAPARTLRESLLLDLLDATCGLSLLTSGAGREKILSSGYPTCSPSSGKPARSHSSRPASYRRTRL